MRATLASLLAIVLLPAVTLGEAFRWVDGEGGVHYGDSPPEGAPAGTVTRLDVYECDSPQCVQMESLRAEQARANVRALQESFARTIVEPEAAPRSYVNTIVREIYVSPFAVPVQRFHRRTPFVTHRSFRGKSFGTDGGRGRSGGGGSSTRTMSMPRF